MAEQLLAVDVGHAGAEAGVAVAQLAVHTVQGVGHGVHGVHHKLDLALLLVAGVASHLLQACEGKTGAGSLLAEKEEVGRRNEEVKQVKWLKKGIVAHNHCHCLDHEIIGCSIR